MTSMKHFERGRVHRYEVLAGPRTNAIQYHTFYSMKRNKQHGPESYVCSDGTTECKAFTHGVMTGIHTRTGPEGDEAHLVWREVGVATKVR